MATFELGRTPGRILHVAPGGSDATGDGSPGQPFQTIVRAARSAAPGTAIYVHAATYDGGVFLSGVRGTETAPIWIVGAPGEARPVIRGGAGLQLTKARYVAIQHLDVRDTDDNGINVDDGGDVGNPDAARFIVFRDIDVHDTGKRAAGVADCLKLSGVNDVAVLDSQFARCGPGPASGSVGVGGVGVHRATIAFNRFHSTGFAGVQVKGGSADIEIHANFFEDAGARGVNMGGSTGRTFFRPPLSSSRPNAEAARVRVAANIFVGGETAAAFAGCLDCEFSRNTVVTPSKWLLRVLQETVSIPGYAVARTARGRITENIFFFRRADVNAGEDINVGTNTDTESYALERNLWFASDAPVQSAPRLPGFRGTESGSLVGRDPAFVSGADFHLRPESPARRAGRASSPASDFDGGCYTVPPNVGALQ